MHFRPSFRSFVSTATHVLHLACSVFRHRHFDRFAQGCAASIETLMVPAVLFINGGIAISAACDKGPTRSPRCAEENVAPGDSGGLETRGATLLTTGCLSGVECTALISQGETQQ